MKDWLTMIHSSHRYFSDKVKINPNKLFLHPKVKAELHKQIIEYKSFTLCDWGLTQFMGCEIRESCDIKDFCWALTVEE